MHSSLRKERVVLVAVENDEGASRAHLHELSQLAEAAGAEDVGRIVQTGDINPDHYLDKDKFNDVKTLIKETKADAIISDDELTDTQLYNLAEVLNIKVLDRTLVILDIFAQRAKTLESMEQVELAQLKYHLAHQKGLKASLSRSALTIIHGGIGGIGPGDEPIEKDEETIRKRIEFLTTEIDGINNKRNDQRKKRMAQNLPIVALVGYANSGKSTLMNTLTGAGVLAENKVFATLDTTTCKAELRNLGTNVLFTDTVGFINKLPSHLMQAFHATMEEVKFADILLHVVDSSSPNQQEEMRVVYETLKLLDCHDQLIITVLNKTDIAVDYSGMRIDNNAYYTVPVSAKTGFNIEELFVAIDNLVKAPRIYVQVLIPHDKAALSYQIYETCRITKQESLKEGTLMEIFTTKEMIGKLKEYLV